MKQDVLLALFLDLVRVIQYNFWNYRYQIKHVLYNPTLGEYRDRDKQAAADKRMSATLNIPTFGPKEFIMKFKNLKSFLPGNEENF